MRALVFILALAATPVIACPTADDLATGIRVTESGDITHLFRTTSPGIVEVISDFGGADGGLNHLFHGTYILRISSLYDGLLDFDSVMLTDYHRDGTALPLPSPGLEQTFKTTVRSFDESYSETQAQSWGALEEITIGDCTTPLIKGTIIYGSEYGTVTETIAYLPDMEIGLLTSYADGDQEPDTYKFIGIEAVE
ncbi:hypothetical protein [Yoonia sp. 2307UL14-13]|uniref:hypothetical protein n=1 Tax=Yoonia sp. 2307UL14-13 TaxID=3126506 RepID=UPI00309BC347